MSGLLFKKYPSPPRAHDTAHTQIKYAFVIFELDCVAPFTRVVRTYLRSQSHQSLSLDLLRSFQYSGNISDPPKTVPSPTCFF